ncbi:hypothetical protein ACWFQ8_31485 [Streptomyces sp. NPDC055254]
MAREHELDGTAGRRPPESTDDDPGGGERADGRSYQGMDGDAFVDFDRLVCSVCDYAWPVLDVGDPTPPRERCPHDGSALTYRTAGWGPGAE